MAFVQRAKLTLVCALFSLPCVLLALAQIPNINSECKRADSRMDVQPNVVQGWLDMRLRLRLARPGLLQLFHWAALCGLRSGRDLLTPRNVHRPRLELNFAAGVRRDQIRHRRHLRLRLWRSQRSRLLKPPNSVMYCGIKSHCDIVANTCWGMQKIYSFSHFVVHKLLHSSYTISPLLQMSGHVQISRHITTVGIATAELVVSVILIAPIRRCRLTAPTTGYVYRTRVHFLAGGHAERGRTTTAQYAIAGAAFGILTAPRSLPPHARALRRNTRARSQAFASRRSAVTISRTWCRWARSATEALAANRPHASAPAATRKHLRCLSHASRIAPTRSRSPRRSAIQHRFAGRTLASARRGIR